MKTKPKATGRPSMGRTKNLPRIKPEHHKALVLLAKEYETSVAGMVELMIKHYQNP